MSAKILVVDDNSVVCNVVSQMLSWLGHEVSSADSGENGLSIFLANIFDIVLSDYEMPGMDGVALACSVKRSAPRTRVPHHSDSFLSPWQGINKEIDHEQQGRFGGSNPLPALR